MKGDPPLPHSVRLSPSPPCCVCRAQPPLSASVRQSPAWHAGSPHKIPHTGEEAALELVRAIRRVMRPAAEGRNLNGGVVMFRVEDVFDFARRLTEQGVTARETTF